MGSTRMGLALLVFVLPIWSLDGLPSFCFLRFLVVCGDISFSSIYLWFLGRLILLVVRMCWGVALSSWSAWVSSLSVNEHLFICSAITCRFLVFYSGFAFMSLASVYCFGLSMICCWFWALVCAPFAAGHLINSVWVWIWVFPSTFYMDASQPRGGRRRLLEFMFSMLRSLNHCYYTAPFIDQSRMLKTSLGYWLMVAFSSNKPPFVLHLYDARVLCPR